MSNEWASYEKDKAHMEAWRRYLETPDAPEVLEEQAVKLLEQQIEEQRIRMVRERKDVQSLIVIEFLKRQSKTPVDITKINEGLWDKAKAGLASLGNFSRLMPGAKMKNVKSLNDLEAAFEEVGQGIAQRVLRTVEKNNFPNVENEDAFRGQMDQIAAATAAIAAAMDAGNMPYEAGKASLELIQQFVKHSLDNKLASAYKTFNEGEEELIEDDLLPEIVGAGSRRLAKFLGDLAMPTGDPSGRTLRVVNRLAHRAAKQGDMDTLGKIKDALVDTDHANLADKALKAYRNVAGAVGTTGAGAAATGGGGGAAAGGAVTGAATTSATAANVPAVITSTVNSTPSLAATLGALGVTPAMAAAAGALALGGAFWAKGRLSSRAASMRSFLKDFKIPAEGAVDAPSAEDVVQGDVTPPKDAEGEEEAGGEVIDFPGKEEPPTETPIAAQAGTKGAPKAPPATVVVGAFRGGNPQKAATVHKYLSQRLASLGMAPEVAKDRQVRNAVITVMQDVLAAMDDAGSPEAVAEAFDRVVTKKNISFLLKEYRKVKNEKIRS